MKRALFLLVIILGLGSFFIFTRGSVDAQEEKQNQEQTQMQAKQIKQAEQGEQTSLRQVPKASDLSSYVVNYNRASAMRATSGSMEKGAASELAQKGIKVFIDLRQTEEGLSQVREEATKAGASYFNIPIGHQGITAAQVKEFTEVYESAGAPVLIHCASGNRVGALWAAYRLSKGVPSAVAFKEGDDAGIGRYLKAAVKRDYCSDC